MDHGSRWRQRQRLRFVRSREPPGGNQRARYAGVRQGRARGVECAGVIGPGAPTAACIAGARGEAAGRGAVDRGGTLPALRTEGRPGSAGAKDRGRARRDDGGGPRSGALSRSDSSGRRMVSRVLTSCVGRFTIAPASCSSRSRRCPRGRTPRIRDQVEALAPVAIDADHEPSRRRAALGQGGGQAGATALASRNPAHATVSW